MPRHNYEMERTFRRFERAKIPLAETIEFYIRLIRNEGDSLNQTLSVQVH